MKYEFHVGDYVESCNGSVGYLTEGETWYSGTVGDDVVHLSGSTTVDVSCGFTPFTITIPFSDISKYFNRIGQYDFTKKDEGKIEPLVKSWILEDADSKGEYYFDSREIIKKINELVDAVNRLKGKVSNQA